MLALNCGFIFYKEWDRSLPSLIKYPNVPLIFTEYYEEDCKLDLQKLDSQVNNFVNPAKFSFKENVLGALVFQMFFLFSGG